MRHIRRLNMLKNFTNSLINHSLNGWMNVNRETFNSRMSICRSCEFFDSSAVRCKQCGCFLNIKASWASEKCPIDKWSSEIITAQSEPQQPQSQPSKDCGCNKKNV